MAKQSSDQRRTSQATNAENLPREVLPIPDRQYKGDLTYDAKDPQTYFPPIEPLRPPQGAPNVLVVLIDDVGFGASSAFGGPCQTPTFEKLAAGGLKYTRFHTTALCAPTRQALLTGRNHHSVGMGAVTEMASSAPGYNSLRPNNKAPLPEILKLNGYATAQFGKCHEVPVWQNNPLGPFDQWPTGGSGFEYFYGFIGGECNQYEPELYDGTTPITPPKTPAEGYHLTEDMADKAISWVRQEKALMGDKPFFMYFAPGATHAPHHVPKEWADKYKGKFNHGWDKQRELTFARQKELGVIPPDAELTKRHEEIPAWDDMPDDLKPVLAREMEVYAGYLSHTDHQVGRVIDALEELGALDDTLVYAIIGDNGASAEGTLQGVFNEMVSLNGLISGIETPEFLKAHIDQFGTPDAYNHYAVGWAHCMSTPYQWTKQIASHWGGTRNGTVVHWPNGIKARGELRSQFCHVIDIAPTILQAAGLPEPTMVHGITQSPMEGVSMNYSFDDAKAAERHDVQYFEMMGNRGIYYKGWSAVTKHRTPWETGQIETNPFDEDNWELYDGNKDWTQAQDLSRELPEQLTKLHTMFAIEAAKYNVFPLDDRLAERFDPDMAGRPQLIKGQSQLLFGGMGRLSELSMVNIKNKSFSVTAELSITDRPANGVIVTQGGKFGGWSFYAKDGKANFAYNFFGINEYRAQAELPLSKGKHQVCAEFAYDGGGLGKGGNVTIYYDGQKVGEGRIHNTIPFAFSAEETTDVGVETGSAVTTDYPSHDSHFSGNIHWVKIDLGKDSFDYLVKPEDRMRVAMTRQ